MGTTHYDYEFIENVLNFYLDNPQLSIAEICRRVGIRRSTFYTWKDKYLDNDKVIDRNTKSYHDLVLEINNLRKELKYKDDTIKIINKVNNSKKKDLIFKVLSNSKNINISKVINNLNINKSSYYKWLNRLPSNQYLRKREAMKKIKEIYYNSHMIYGAPKIHHILNNSGFSIALKTVTNYMRELDIKAVYCKKKVKYIKNDKVNDNYRNILNRNFNVNVPNKVWCIDITYLYTLKGFVYLTSIMDLYSRKIISYKVSNKQKVRDVIECLDKALKARKVRKKSNPT